MRLKDYEILKDLLEEFQRELSDIENRIEHNKQHINVAEVYLSSYFNSESDDHKVFSPRDNSLQMNEMDKINIQKKEYEDQNKSLYQKRDELKERIGNLKIVLEHKDIDFDVLDVQEKERQRIARDLHDTSLQNLTHLIHKIELSSLYIDQDQTKAKLELSAVNKILKETINEIRNIIFDLRPMTFDDLGMKAALERLLAEINENKKYVIKSDIENVSCEKKSVLVFIYRIVQESLNNIIKHADAKKIYFNCKYNKGCCIIDIKDDGKGFGENLAKDKHFGLALMRERINILQGKMNIKSKPGKGTEIHIEIPLDIYSDEYE